MSVNYDKLPPHMQSGARLYVENGVPPGNFLTSVLENNFAGSIAGADHVNRCFIRTWADWLLTECPADAWGSPVKVKNWIDHGGMKGEVSNDVA